MKKILSVACVDFVRSRPCITFILIKILNIIIPDEPQPSSLPSRSCCSRRYKYKAEASESAAAVATAIPLLPKWEDSGDDKNGMLAFFFIVLRFQYWLFSWGLTALCPPIRALDLLRSVDSCLLLFKYEGKIE